MRRRAVIVLLRAGAASVLVAGCVGTAPPAPSKPPAAASSARPPQAAATPPRSGPKPQAEECAIPGMREALLKQVNAARAVARSCGGKRMGAVRPLAWNTALETAAFRHSTDMADRDYFDHLSPDGKRVAQRLTAEGYKWRTVGENLAGGDMTVPGVMKGWLGSPEHCQNIMSPAYTEIGVACISQPRTRWENYWTMILATRR